MADQPRPTPTQALLEHFRFDHLPEDLQAISQPICELALQMETVLLDGPEKTVGLRKLLEAKDCLVRQRIVDRRARAGE